MINIKINSRIEERKSDRYYADFIQFFIELLLKSKPTYVPWGMRERSRNYLMYPVVRFQLPDSVLPTAYNKYRKNVDDEVDGKHQIFPDYKTFEQFMKRFSLNIAPSAVNGDQNFAGTMNANGELTIYLQDWKAKGVPGGEPTNNQMHDEVSKRIMQNASSYIPEVVNAVEGVIAHELGHYINSIRAEVKKGKIVHMRSKGGMKQFDGNAQEYADSTEELQARISDFTTHLSKIINLTLEDIKDVHDRWLVYHLGRKDKRGFVEYAMTNIWYFSMFLHKNSQKFKNRLRSRLSQIFDEFSEDDTHVLNFTREKFPKAKGADLKEIPPPPPPPPTPFQTGEAKLEEDISDYYGGSELDMRIPDRKPGKMIIKINPLAAMQPISHDQTAHLAAPTNKGVDEELELDEDLLFEELIYEKKDRCYHLAKQKYDVFPSAYASGFIVRCRKGKVGKRKKKVNEQLDEVIEIEEGTFDKEKSQGLHGWFARKGGKGKSKGWVDCNTCRTNPKTGKKTCQTCGRTSGEKRSKYPACRPTPSACTKSGTSRKKSSMRVSWKPKKEE